MQDPKDPVKRFAVVFEAIDRRSFSYYVCTLQDEKKALVLATEAHFKRNASVPIYRVARLDRVEGDRPEGNDIVDRAEW